MRVFSFEFKNHNCSTGKNYKDNFGVGFHLENENKEIKTSEVQKVNQNLFTLLNFSRISTTCDCSVWKWYYYIFGRLWYFDVCMSNAYMCVCMWQPYMCRCACTCVRRELDVGVGEFLDCFPSYSLSQLNSELADRASLAS